MNPPRGILHVIGPGTPSPQLETLKRLLRAHERIGPQTVACFGGPAATDGLDRVTHVSKTGADGPLARLGLTDGGHRFEPASLIHLWSQRALEWTLRQRQAWSVAGVRGAAVVISLDLSSAIERVVRRTAGAERIYFAAAGAAAAAELLRCQADPQRCALIREDASPRERDADLRERMRGRLRLSPEHEALLVLPPVTRAAGSLTGVWGALLAQRVRPQIRILLPEEGREVTRIVRFVDASLRRSILRAVGRSFALQELLAGADLALYTPPSDAPESGLAQALAAGVRTVASDVAAVREAISEELARPGRPKDVARLIVLALEQQRDVPGPHASKPSRTAKPNAPTAMIEAFAKLYLAARSDGALPVDLTLRGSC